MDQVVRAWLSVEVALSAHSRPVDRTAPKLRSKKAQSGAEKPLFIPLMSKPFADFLSGDKTFELRLYGPRWNEKTCRVGRRVVLSRGYGKKARLVGKVGGFEVSTAGEIFVDWREYFPKASADTRVAVIAIALNAVQQLSRTAIDPRAPWPFPSAPPGPKPSPKPKGLRYLDEQGVERVYSFRGRHAHQAGK